MVDERSSTNNSTLAGPVGALLRPSGSIAAEDSLDRAAAELRRSGNGLVPVLADNIFVGVVTERSLGLALANGVSSAHPASEALAEATTVRPYETAASVLRLIAEGAGPTVVVTDDLGRLVGIVSPSDLYPRRRQLPRPALVGGMATPFGVYLTNGAISGGASQWALIATGASMFAMLASAAIVASWVSDTLGSHAYPAWMVAASNIVLQFGLFLLAMRMVPLSGTHAAEHQVVHALERGEELRPEIVRRMPRVHPRCGTNLAVGAMLFTGIFSLDLIPGIELRFLLAVITTYFFWRRIGGWIQYYVTTKPANDRQIASGIKAANELLERFARSSVTAPGPMHRIMKSGLLHVMAGSTACMGLLLLLTKYVFHFDLFAN